MVGMHRSTIVTCCLMAVALTACAKKDNAAVDSTAVVTPADSVREPVAPAPLNLADVAGKWNVRSVPTTGDTTAINSVLDAKSTADGWTLTLPNRKPVAEHITVAGDSVVAQSDPYQSVLRKGVTVTTTSVYRLQGGNLVGQTTAHYKVKTADSVLVLNSTATRAK